ncbi:MAG TPA: sigma-70 family RNA polymerase sigma factor [Polyangiaceae bacterium]|nr:sigma-70 family RNA polymerase sigma factor [Polyangiaceae bacterium]
MSDETFVRYLAERMSGPGDVMSMLAAVHSADLYLACACRHGDPRAIAAFEERYVATVALHLSGSDAQPLFSQELKQTLRERVLVADSGLVPRIASYNGRGPLGGWLRMVAARIAVDLRRAEKKAGSREAFFSLPLPTLDPELAYIKERYRREFENALESAFTALAPREGAIMRLYFLDGVGAAAIGAMYRVSSRTVQRWIASTQQTILRDTRRVLTEKLSLSTTELDSLLGLVQSQLGEGLDRYLKKSTVD